MDKATNTEKKKLPKLTVISNTSLETAVEFVSLLEKKAAPRLGSKEEADYLEVIESYSPNDSILSSKYLKLEAERDEGQASAEVEDCNNFTKETHKPSFKKVGSFKTTTLDKRGKPWLASKPGGIVDSIKNKVLNSTKHPNCNDTGTFFPNSVPIAFCLFGKLFQKKTIHLEDQLIKKLEKLVLT